MAKRVEISISESLGLERTDIPISVSVPFARGDLFDTGKTRLLSDKGNEIPSQVRTLSNWPDGSIRWLWLFWQAGVEPFGCKVLALEYGRDVMRREYDTPLTVVQEKDVVNINTGPLKLQVSTCGFSLFDQVHVQGKPVLNEGADRGIQVADGEGLVYTISLDRNVALEVEESGPLRAVIKAAGKHTAENGKTFLDYLIRIYAYAGKPYVEVDYSFINRENYPQSANDWSNCTKRTSEIKKIYHILPLDFKIDHYYLDDQEYYEPCYLLHTGEDLGDLFRGSYSVCSIDGEELNSSDVRSGQGVGGIAQGVAGVSGDNIGAAVFMRNFSANAPKRMDVSERGIDISIWPEDVPPLKFVQGMAKTHRLLYYFSPISIEAREQLFYYLNHPVVATISQERYLEVEAVPPFLPYRPKIYSEWEEFLKDIHRSANLAKWKDVDINGRGMIDFGDQKSVHFSLQRSAGVINRWWNNRWDILHSMLLQFIRTGDKEYFIKACPYADHLMDIDIIHHAEDKRDIGGVHGVEGINHVSGGPPSSYRCWAEGIVDYYHLSGDRRALENARLVGDWLIDVGRTGYGLARNVRGEGVPIQVLSAVYEATGDEKYLEGAKLFADILINTQEEDGAWRRFDPPSRKVAAPWKSGIALTGLMRYHMITKDERTKKAFIEGAHWMITKGITPEGYFYYYDMPDHKHSVSTALGSMAAEALGYAYQLTNDKKYIEVSLKNWRRSSHLGLIPYLAQQLPLDYTHFALLSRGYLRALYWADKIGLMSDIFGGEGDRHRNLYRHDRKEV